MKSCLYQAAFCIQLGQLLNICLCVDLVLMVRYPFESKDGRVSRYLIISIFLALIPTIFECIHGTVESKIRLVGLGMAFSLRLIFVATFIFSVAYTWNKMRGPSFSKEVRRLVLKRHIITALLYLITNLYMAINELTGMMASTQQDLNQVYGTN